MRSRDLMGALRWSARTFPVAVVTGPRQSGRTTLLPSLYFWRSSDQIEVDVVVEYQGELHGFEIKAGETLTPGDGGALKKWRELGGIPADNCALLAPIPRPLPLGAGIVAHPWTLAGWDWLAQREGGGAGS